MKVTWSVKVNTQECQDDVTLGLLFQPKENVKRSDYDKISDSEQL